MIEYKDYGVWFIFRFIKIIIELDGRDVVIIRLGM